MPRSHAAPDLPPAAGRPVPAAVPAAGPAVGAPGRIRGLPLPAALFAVLASPGVLAAPDAGALHQQHCVSCHGSEVYTRAERRVKDLPTLGTQVRMCEQNLGLKWFDDEVDAVTGLLNRDYYKFQP